MNYTCMTHSLDELLPAPGAAHHHGGERRIELVPDQAVSLDAVRGTVVDVPRGSVWLTQEGHWQDYFLVAGMSYVSLDAGRIVLNAPERASTARVYRIELAPGERACDAVVNLGGGTIARIARDARRARAAEVRRWFGVLAGAWRRLWGRDQAADHRARKITA